MKLNTLLLASLLAGMAPLAPLAAQTVIAPPPKLDSAQTAVRDALYRLRDSLQLVDAAASRIAKDRSRSSDALMRSRASLVALRCEATARTLAPTRSIVNDAALPTTDPKGLRVTLIRSLDSLEIGMRNCAVEFERLKQPANSTELRDYGIGRGERVREYIRRHDVAVSPYFESVTGVRYEANRRGAGAVAAPTRTQ